jgi:hypothetical protein
VEVGGEFSFLDEGGGGFVGALSGVDGGRTREFSFLDEGGGGFVGALSGVDGDALAGASGDVARRGALIVATFLF